MRKLFELQTQPPQAQTDYLTTLVAANTAANDEWHIDKLSGCAYPRPLFVPHNQDPGEVSGGEAVDTDLFVAPGSPSLHWDNVTIGSGNKLQCFPNRPFGYQYFDCVWNQTAEPVNSSYDAHAYLDSDSGNAPAQGVVFLVSRTVFHKVPTTGPATWEIRWVANLRLYSVLVSTKNLALVRVSQDDGATWQTITPRLQVGGSVFQVGGNMYPGLEGGGVPVELLLMNQTLSLTLGAQTAPLPIPQKGADPTVPPKLTAEGGGHLDPGTYQVGYTYHTPDGEETALSPISWLSLGSGGGIKVDVLPLPSGADEIRYYVGDASGMVYAGSGTGGILDIDHLPPADQPHAPPFSTVKPKITQIRVLANYFTQFHCEAHPVKWSVEANLLSNPFSLGFSPDPGTPPYYQINGLYGAVKRTSGSPWNLDFPTGSVATVTTATDPTAPDQQYYLQLTNQANGTYQDTPYGDLTAALTRVATKVDGLWVPTSGDNPTAAIPVDVVQRTRFDPVGLTICRTLDFTLNNLHGQHAGKAANYAVTLALEMIQPAGPAFSRFTGFVDTHSYQRPESARAYYRASACDQMQQLQENILLYTPDFDGHNHYWVMRFLANYAGITDSQIGFLDLVPDDPFTFAAGDFDPFFLPFGDGMNPWTPRARTMPVLDLGNYVRQSTGFLLFIDPDGFLQYQPWIPPVAGTPDKVFTEVPGGMPGDITTSGSNLSEYWNLHVRKSNRNVKNQTMLFGVDPWGQFFNHTITILTDFDSIDSDADPRPDNFKGYRSQLFYSSPQFASPAYAQRSAARLFTIARLTDYEVSFDTWLQPQLNVMDVIQVDDPRSGATNVPFYVMETADHWSIISGAQIMRTSVSGKFLAELLGGGLEA